MRPLRIITLAILSAISLQAQKNIPFDDDVEDPNLISLGPIGVRVKTDHREERHPRSKSDSGTVKHIFKNSLAENKLKLGDEIIGINGTKFRKNFTELLADEIDKAEGSEGILELAIQRDGKPMTVRIELERIGSYSKTWPYNCEKSAAILRKSCDWLVGQQQADGRFEIDDEHFVLTSVAGLAMLGCDETKYREPISKTVEYLTNHLKEKTNSEGHFEDGILELWSLTYATIFLSEYHLRTGDEKVVESLKFLNKEIYHRQFHQIADDARAHLIEHLESRGFEHDPAPPFWFSHGLLSTTTDGYVHLGANVANACLAWELLDKAGVEIDRENLTSTYDYVEEVCLAGVMGYASFPNQTRFPQDSFGRTGAMALAFDFEQGRPEYLKTVNAALKKLYPQDYYFSHATCVMGKAWGTLAIAAVDKKEFRKLMDEMKGDFDLLRLHDGSFVSNPAQKNVHGFMDLTIGGAGDKHRWTTAFNALIYTLAEGKLLIAGGER
ncbi:MAG: DUF6288 domain-containing protein [Luteolibacter sp.]